MSPLMAHTSPSCLSAMVRSSSGFRPMTETCSRAALAAPPVLAQTCPIYVRYRCRRRRLPPPLARGAAPNACRGKRPARVAAPAQLRLVAAAAYRRCGQRALGQHQQARARSALQAPPPTLGLHQPAFLILQKVPCSRGLSPPPRRRWSPTLRATFLGPRALALPPLSWRAAWQLQAPVAAATRRWHPSELTRPRPRAAVPAAGAPGCASAFQRWPANRSVPHRQWRRHLSCSSHRWLRAARWTARPCRRHSPRCWRSSVGGWMRWSRS
mmetsp:Transcript_91739/g.255537  ORF Transcript_91739/g.255537 Transcript_91739/m.255537 type:complete len:269 (-) Transcript_91739:323-1129(-)